MMDLSCDFYTFSKQEHQLAKNNKKKGKFGASVHIAAVPDKGKICNNLAKYIITGQKSPKLAQLEEKTS